PMFHRLNPLSILQMKLMLKIHLITLLYFAYVSSLLNSFGFLNFSLKMAYSFLSPTSYSHFPEIHMERPSLRLNIHAHEEKYITDLSAHSVYLLNQRLGICESLLLL